MIFSKKISKFGKGHNLSALLKNNSLVEIYYFNKGTRRINLTINNDHFNIEKTNYFLNYEQAIPLDHSHIVVRMGRSIAIINNDNN